MSETVYFDLQEIFKCCACKDDRRGFGKHFIKQAPHCYYKKHPPAGHGRELFFVNINPRSRNNCAMEWAMESPENFQKFSNNLYRNKRYIPDCESFYDIHYRICKAIFPERAFEAVAIVHEMYLCATRNDRRLPRSSSPCADRYMWQHLLKVRPKLVVAFGARAANFFGNKVRELTNVSVRLIPLPFRVIRGSEERKARVIDYVKRCFDAVSTSDPFPTYDFGETQPPRRSNGNSAKRLHSYARVRALGTLSLICDPCPNYQPRGDKGATRWRLARDFATAGATFQAATNRTGLSKGYLQYFIEKGGIAVDGLTGKAAYSD